jgi:hypothetical protein
LSRKVLTLPSKKVVRLKVLARRLVCAAARKKRLVPKHMVVSFAGYANHCCLALPWGRFYLASLYEDMGAVEGWERHQCVRLSHRTVSDLNTYWLDLQNCITE